ncbi:MAG: PEP-utilizing enzyme [Candidatus Gracilibacteria bacterium]
MPRLKKEYKDFSFSFPRDLSFFHTQIKTQYEGVSQGESEGILVDENGLRDLLQKDKSGKNFILYSQILSPHLAAYFSRISGILSSQGGMLSHLAILAREHKIPVIVGFKPTKEICLGTKIKIDASKVTVHCS